MFLVFSPFIGILAMAAIFSMVLQPMYKKILFLLRFEWLSSLAVILILAVFIAIPLVFLSWQIFQEAQSLYVQVAGAEIPYLEKLTLLIEKPIQNFVPDFSINLKLYSEKFFNWFIGNLGPIVSGTTQIFFNFILLIIILFFFLKDNEKFKKNIIELSPLENKYDNLIIEKIETAVNSVIKGSLLIAMAQGLLAGIGFWIFGIPSPTLWGTVGAVCSLIPGVGTAIVTVPAVIYLIINGNLFAAISLLIWGLILVGLTDNLLRPIFYKKGVPTHPIFILFAVLGGLTFFGPAGLIFGPVVLSLFLAVLEIYKTLLKSQQE